MSVGISSETLLVQNILCRGYMTLDEFILITSDKIITIYKYGGFEIQPDKTIALTYNRKIKS